MLEKLRQYEPLSMSGQPLVIWDRAEGIQVYDRWGNMWLDWSSGVLVANAGHNHPKIRQAILDQVHHGLVHNYCFPSASSGRLDRTAGIGRAAGRQQGLPADDRRRGLRMRDQTGPNPRAQDRAATGKSPSSPFTTRSTAARWACKWRAASRR